MARKANYYKLNSERCGFPNVPRSWFSEVILAVSVSFVLAAHRDTSFQLQWSWRQLSQVKHLCQVFFSFFSFYLGSRCEATGRGQRLWQEPAGAELSLSQSYFVNLHLVPVRFLIWKNRREGDLAPAYLPFALPCYYINNRKDEHLPKGRGSKWRNRWINVSAAKHRGGSEQVYWGRPATN